MLSFPCPGPVEEVRHDREYRPSGRRSRLNSPRSVQRSAFFENPHAVLYLELLPGRLRQNLRVGNHAVGPCVGPLGAGNSDLLPDLCPRLAIPPPCHVCPPLNRMATVSPTLTESWQAAGRSFGGGAQSVPAGTGDRDQHRDCGEAGVHLPAAFPHPLGPVASRPGGRGACEKGEGYDERYNEQTSGRPGATVCRGQVSVKVPAPRHAARRARCSRLNAAGDRT